MVLTEKYFEGKVPKAVENAEVKIFVTAQRDKISEALENFKFREALTEVMNIARYGNKLLTDKEPWKTFKENPEATGAVLYDSLQIIAGLSIVCEPFLPFTSKKLFGMLNMDAKNFSWADIGRQDLLPMGHLLGKAELLYQKVEDETIQKQIEKLHGAKSPEPLKVENKVDAAPVKTEPEFSETEPEKPEITFDEFAKLDLRVGTVLTAEKVQKADKLLKLTVDLGFEIRTVVSGIAEFFKPEDIIGQQVSVVANLAPRKIRGIESKGMILLAEDEMGVLHFVLPKELTKNGSIIR
jgi:methionyl-tRNA synthetase